MKNGSAKIQDAEIAKYNKTLSKHFFCIIHVQFSKVYQLYLTTELIVWVASPSQNSEILTYDCAYLIHVVMSIHYERFAYGCSFLVLTF